MTNKKQILSSKEVKDVFLDYVNDKTYNYAMMLDGDWGSGKTYFVKKELIPYIEENKGKEIKKIVYISLYGINELTDITKNIYMEAYLASKTKKKFAQVSSISMDLFFEFLKNKGVGINQDKTEKFFSDFFEIDDTLLIFDDLERCKIPVNEVLGFINGFVEHSELKVIIITNEKEIGSVKEDSAPDEEKQEYLRIKEKLVGNTIVYTPNIDETLLQLINSAVTESGELKSNLINKIPYFISVMKFRKHINFRTFQFYLSKVSKLYKLLYSDKITKNDAKDEFMDSIVEEIFPICCEFKQGVIKKEETMEIPYYIDNKDKNSEFIKSFVETSLVTSTQLQEALEIYHNTQSSFAKEPYQNLQQMKSVCEITEKEVIKLIRKIQDNIEQSKYQIYDFCEIIYCFISLENIGFDESYLNTPVKQMEKAIDKTEQLQHIDLITNNQYIFFLKQNKINATRFLTLCKELQMYLETKNNAIKNNNISCLLTRPNFIESIQIASSYKGRSRIEDIFSEITAEQLLPKIVEQPTSVFGFHRYLNQWTDEYLNYLKGDLTYPMNFYINYFSELDRLLIEDDYKDIVLKYNIRELKTTLKSLVEHIENEIKKTSPTATK